MLYRYRDFRVKILLLISAISLTINRPSHRFWDVATCKHQFSYHTSRADV